MFQITMAQLHAMRTQRTVLFQQRLEVHLQQFFPSHEIHSKPYWTKHFQLIMQRCKVYQFQSEAAITIFFNATCCLGLNFDCGIGREQLLRVLISKFLPEREKVAKLIATVEDALLTAPLSTATAL